MTQPTHSNTGPLIRSNVGNSGDTTFVDYHNLHPTNEVAATAAGALSGGVLGATGLLFLHTLSPIGERNGFKKPGLLLSTSLVAIPAVIGAITGFLNAKTHNDWSSRVLDSVEKQKNRSADGQAR